MAEYRRQAGKKKKKSATILVLETPWEIHTRGEFTLNLQALSTDLHHMLLGKTGAGQETRKNFLKSAGTELATAARKACNPENM